MDAKHTQGPWGLLEVANNSGTIKHLVPVDSTGMSLLTVVDDGNANFAAVYLDSDARRIVACVNACDGISTENLEQNRPVKWLAKHYNTASKQRDELLEALQRVVRMLEIEDARLANFGETEAARGAISNVKEGSA